MSSFLRTALRLDSGQPDFQLEGETALDIEAEQKLTGEHDRSDSHEIQGRRDGLVAKS